MSDAATQISSSMPRQTARPLRRIAAAFTGAAAALALMTATALPARADRASDDLAKALVAALAIGAIVHSIDKGRAQPRPVPEPPHQVRSPRVPAVCAIEISGNRRDVTVYPERCLRREGFDHRLPRYCAREARVFGRPDRIYGEECLRDAGFRIEGGRDWHRDDRGRGHGHGRDRDRNRHDH